MRDRWSAEKAWAWRAEQGRLLGCNFIPSTAVNQLEFWQAESFDPETIRRELDWAAALGMNALRVFLHDLAYAADPEGFLGRLERFLAWAAERGLRTMPVLFDDCWYEGAAPGPQAAPRPGVHNSRWVRSPGLRAARDESQTERLAAYVGAVVGAFARDRRVLAWDLYNEVGNFFLPLLALPAPIKQLSLLGRGLSHYLLPIPTLTLFRMAARWARSADPEQPVTSPLWFKSPSLNRALMEESDVVSFHHYRDAADLERYIRELSAYGRPLLCTEYLARTTGSLFRTALPVFGAADIPCFNWGLVAGKTQTQFTWTDRPGAGAEGSPWYHDILRPDGSPYDEGEAALLRAYLGSGSSGGTGS